jgi:hypothetical protein
MDSLEITGLKAYAESGSVTLYWSWPKGVTKMRLRLAWKKPHEERSVYKSAYDVLRRYVYRLGPMDGGELLFELFPCGPEGEPLAHWKAAASAVAPPVKVTYAIREERFALAPWHKAAYIHIDSHDLVDASLLYYQVNGSPCAYPLPAKLTEEVGPIFLRAKDKIMLRAANQHYFLMPTT